MKPKVHCQQNHEPSTKFMRIDDEIEILVSKPIGIKEEIKIGPGLKCKEVSSVVKEENVKCVSESTEHANDFSAIAFATPRTFFPSAHLVGKKHNKRVKNSIMLSPLTKKENDEIKKNSIMGLSSSSNIMYKEYDGDCDDKKLKSCDTSVNMNNNNRSSRNRNSIMPEYLPSSSGKVLVQSEGCRTFMSPESKRNFTSGSNRVVSKFGNGSLTKSVIKAEPARANAFYNSQSAKLEVNEADTPPSSFAPANHIECSDARNAEVSPEVIYVGTRISGGKRRRNTTRSKHAFRGVLQKQPLKKSPQKLMRVQRASVLASSLAHMQAPRSRSREVSELYKNLQETSWAHDRDFTDLLRSKESSRHMGRMSSKTPGTSPVKDLFGRKNRDVRKDKKIAKKPVISSLVPKQKHVSHMSFLKSKLHKSAHAQNALTKQPMTPVTLECEKPLENKITKSAAQAKGTISKMKQKSAICRKKTFIDKNRKLESSNLKLLPSGKKTISTMKDDQSLVNKEKPRTFNNEIRLESSYQEVSIWGSVFKEPPENNILSALQKGQELRVTLQPLEKSDLWLSDCETEDGIQKECEAYTRKSLQQRMLKVFTGIDQRHISSVLREVHDSRSSSSSSSKGSRKRKHDEECVRSSVRQSECAFRYKEIVVKKHEHYIQVVLVPNSNKQNSLTVEAMKELKEAFQSARKDTNCKAVLLNSSGSFFCSGIDLGQLCGSNKKHLAEEMAVTIRDLILTLAIFPKPVVAAVNGCSIGLGVSLLTFCDIVLASDKATFSIPSAKFGYVPEGGVMLTLPQVVGSTVALEMLLQGRRLTAEQALKYGLVSEIIWPTQLMEEVVPRIQSLVKQPLQVMELTKTMVRCHLWEKLGIQLNHEWRLLPVQWLSSLCQQNIKRHLQTGWQID